MSDFPYAGLRPFKREETDIFFGRDTQTNELLERLGSNHFLAVLGPSGCGKSSLVRTGLMAGLDAGLLVTQGTHWAMAEMRPGDDPFGRLAQALVDQGSLGEDYIQPLANEDESYAFLHAGLRRNRKGLSEILEHAELAAGTKLLILVDQFEELFRFHQEGGSEIAAAFVDLLLESSRNENIYIVITMRSDFLGDCSLYRGLPEAINEGLYLTPRLEREQLHEAIAYPAKVFGGEVEPELVNHLVNTVGNDPDQLPLLQHTLMRLWQKSSLENPEKPCLTLDAYEKLGGLHNALSDHADTIYNNLTDPQQKISETMFRVLTEREADGRDIRRPIQIFRIAELAEVRWQEVSGVIEQFRAPGRHFLMPPLDTPLETETIVDISHESLIRQWKTLQKWVKDESEMAHEFQRLSQHAKDYKAGKGALLQSPGLENFLHWQQHFDPTSSWAERYASGLQEALDFLDQSAEEKNKQLRKEEEDRQRELTANRKYRTLFVVALFIAFGAVVAGGWAVFQTNEAKLAEKDAQHNWGLALKEQSNSNQNPLKKHLYALHALEKLNPQKDKQYYQKVVSRVLTNPLHLPVYRINNGAHHESEVFSVAFSPDGKTIASGSNDGNIGIWNLETGIRLKTFTGHKGSVNCVAFASDGKTIASASLDNTIGIWNVDNGKRMRTLEGHSGGVESIAFSPNGKIIASAAFDGTIGIWELHSGTRIKTLVGHNGGVASIAFSPDGNTLGSSSYDNTIGIWDINSGKRIKSLTGHTNTVKSVKFSPDGKVLASSSHDTTIGIWDVHTGVRVKTLQNQESVNSVAFAPDGKTIAAGVSDITLWDFNSGKIAQILPGHSDFVSCVTISPDGNTLVSSSHDNTIGIWNLQTGKRVTPPTGHLDSVNSVAFSPDGRTLASAADDTTIRIWDLISGKKIKTLAGHSDHVQSVAFSPDGKTLASAANDFTINIWDLNSGNKVRTLSGHGSGVNFIEFSPDGKTIISAADDHTISLWDPNSGKKLKTLSGHRGHVNSVTFAPDGKTIISAAEDSTIGLWDFKSGKRIKTLSGHSKNINSVTCSPDGTTIASAADDNTIIIWDVNKGQKTTTLTGHSDHVNSVAFSPDGKFLVSAADDNTVRLWNFNTGKIVKTLSGHNDRVQSVAFSPDGKTVVSAGDDNSIDIWDLGIHIVPGQIASEPYYTSTGSGELEFGKIMKIPSGYREAFNSIKYSPDGKTIATAAQDNIIRIWDATTAKSIKTLLWHNGTYPVNSITFAPDGRTIASAAQDDPIFIWDLNDGSIVQSLTGHFPGWLTTLSFTADGKTLISASNDNTFDIWDLNHGKRMETLSGPRASVECVAFAPDGKTIATKLYGRSIDIVDLDSKKQLKTIPDFQFGIGSIAFAPDGKTVASASEENTIVLWDLAVGKKIKTLAGHEGPVNSIAFAPDGESLASASADNTIGLWELKFGKRIKTFIGHTGSVESVAFAPDGKTIVSGSDDNVMGIWDPNDTNNIWLGLSLNSDGDYILDLDRLPYELIALDLQFTPSWNLYPLPKTEVRWSEKHPFHWITKAERGDTNAMVQLGLIYDRSSDHERALYWYSQAADLGSQQGLERLQFLEEWLQQERLNRIGEQVAAEVESFFYVEPFDKIAFSNYFRDLDVSPKVNLPPHVSDTLCWWGSLTGNATKAMGYCNKAVKVKNWVVYDSRGVARVFTGDIQGAIDDFQFAINTAPQDEEEFKTERLHWIRLLQKGNNPFTKEILSKLY